MYKHNLLKHFLKKKKTYAANLLVLGEKINRSFWKVRQVDALEMMTACYLKIIFFLLGILTSKKPNLWDESQIKVKLPSSFTSHTFFFTCGPNPLPYTAESLLQYFYDDIILYPF